MAGAGLLGWRSGHDRVGWDLQGGGGALPTPLLACQVSARHRSGFDNMEAAGTSWKFGSVQARRLPGTLCVAWRLAGTKYL